MPRLLSVIPLLALLCLLAAPSGAVAAPEPGSTIQFIPSGQADWNNKYTCASSRTYPVECYAYGRIRINATDGGNFDSYIYYAVQYDKVSAKNLIVRAIYVFDSNAGGLDLWHQFSCYGPCNSNLATGLINYSCAPVPVDRFGVQKPNWGKQPRGRDITVQVTNHPDCTGILGETFRGNITLQ